MRFKSIIVVFFVSLFASISVGQVTYKDVAPIFYSRCTSCHNQYSHGTPLLNYSEVNSNASSIEAYLTSGYMPSWKPDTSYTRFVHEHIITLAEKIAILNWIANGAVKGDTTQAPAAPVYTRYQLTGTPDLELKIPTFVSNASSTDSHVSFALPTGITQDNIIRAFEIVAGNPSIVHHVIVSIDTTGTQVSNTTNGAAFPPSGNIIIGGYAPGANPAVYPGQAPLKMGTLLKKGSNIVFNIHYPAGTAGQADSTKIRIYFYPTGTAGVRLVKRLAIHNNSLNIPANTVDTFTAQYPHTSGTITSAMSIFSTFPHSHHLCTQILNYAYPATDTIPLIKINNWDFNFQGYYTYKKLVKVNPSYKLYAKHVFDNTTQNPNNPSNPPINVSFGSNSSDEMLEDVYEYIDYQPGDEFINVDSLLSKDSLLITSIKQNLFLTNNINNYVYPNPNKGYFIVSSGEGSKFIEISDMLGNVIYQTTSSEQNHYVNLVDKSPGVYYVKITFANSNKTSVMKIIVQ
ncbi:MAG TPA: T9SS type A sorting domain-containing protein [Bacteroidia bacterium]|nr:T9SS type A sorting domain-containing protein [Bacteroidia bacterium]